MSQVKQVGNSATGFSNSFMGMLGNLFGTGGPGAGSALGQQGRSNPIGQTQGGVQGILSDILSPGAGKLGGALGSMINQQQTRDTQGINERFSSFGGTSLGSPAAGALAQYKAQAAPAAASAIGNLQLGAISPLLGAGGFLAGRGVTTPMMQTSPFMQGLQALPGLSQGVGSILSGLNMNGGSGGGGGNSSGGMMSGGDSNIAGLLSMLASMGAFA